MSAIGLAWRAITVRAASEGSFTPLQYIYSYILIIISLSLKSQNTKWDVDKERQG